MVIVPIPDLITPYGLFADGFYYANATHNWKHYAIINTMFHKNYTFHIRYLDSTR